MRTDRAGESRFQPCIRRLRNGEEHPVVYSQTKAGR